MRNTCLLAGVLLVFDEFDEAPPPQAARMVSSSVKNSKGGNKREYFVRTG
jgi:hypothetical protein